MKSIKVTVTSFTGIPHSVREFKTEAEAVESAKQWRKAGFLARVQGLCGCGRRVTGRSKVCEQCKWDAQLQGGW